MKSGNMYVIYEGVQIMHASHAHDCTIVLGASHAHDCTVVLDASHAHNGTVVLDEKS